MWKYLHIFFVTDGFKSQYALCLKQFLNNSEL